MGESRRPAEGSAAIGMGTSAAPNSLLERIMDAPAPVRSLFVEVWLACAGNNRPGSMRMIASGPSGEEISFPGGVSLAILGILLSAAASIAKRWRQAPLQAAAGRKAVGA